MRRDDISKLEVFAGVRRNPLPGAVMGFGLVGGITLGLFQACGECEGTSPALKAGALGAVLGGAIGLAKTTDRWENAARSPARVVVTPLWNRGVGIRVSLRF